VRRPSLWPGSRSFYGFGARQYIGVGQYVPRFIYVPLCPLPYPKSKSYRINKITLKEVCIKEAAGCLQLVVKRRNLVISEAKITWTYARNKVVIWRFDHTFSAFTNKLRGSHEQTKHGRQMLYNLYIYT
jgi:hypothetical protein